jgi:hypothetical protein
MAALLPVACRAMQELIDLYRHNGWANERVFAVAQNVDASLLEVDAAGTRGTVKATLAHLARVEYVSLTMIQGKPRESVASLQPASVAGPVVALSAGHPDARPRLRRDARRAARWEPGVDSAAPLCCYQS